MKEREEDLSKTIQRLVLGALAAFTFAAIVCLRAFFEGIVVESLSPALEAFFIALVLALTVDPLLKREFFREATSDIFLFWLGYSLPDQVNDFLRDFVTETKLLRTDCLVIWTLQEHAPGRVRVELEVSYDMQNVTNQWQSYQQQAQAIDSLPGERTEVLEMRCVSRAFPSQEYDWGPLDFQHMPDGFLAGPSTSIPPQTRLQKRSKRGLPHDMFRFTMRYSSEHSLSGTDSWLTAAPVLNLRVICRPADKFEFTTAMENFEETGPGEWQLGGVLLQNYGFNVVWKPRAQPTIPAV